MKLNLNNFGKKLKFNRRTKKEKTISEEELFVESIGLLDHCWGRSVQLYEIFKVNHIEYDEDYFRIAENLLLLKYGYWKTEIILWYIFERMDEEGGVYPLTVQHEGKEDEEVLITTPAELWNFFLKFEDLKNENNE